MNISVLWSQYKTSPDEDLKKKIMLNYLKLVHYVIHHNKFLNFDILDDRDYFQFGIEGLSEAIDRFDPDYGTKFETYAIQRIRGKIIDELRKIQIKPRSLSNNPEDIVYSNVSLNHSFDDDEGYMLYETIPNDSETPTEVTEKNEAKELLVKTIKELGERERMIITLYYYEELSYKEIADVLSITVSRVSQVHTKIMAQLKNKLMCLHE
ncbi:MAG: sigma-70 family RNA polymerase sigma factor [Ignavibacteriaceae bacterium]